MKFIFQGFSDDTFGEYNETSEDYDCCANGAMIIYQLTSPDGDAVNICGQYGGKGWPDAAPGCWISGVQQVEEDRPIPNWLMRYDMGECGYSPALIIQAPEGTTLKCLNREDDAS